MTHQYALEQLETRLCLSADFISAAAIGGAGTDQIKRVTTDFQGNRFVMGTFSGTVDFAQGRSVYNLTSAGGVDIFVAKYAGTGELIWAHSLGGTGTEEAGGLAVDSDGSVLVTGGFTGSADFNPTHSQILLQSAGKTDAFVWKLSSNGRFIWARGFGSTSYDVAQDIVVVGNGFNYVVGSFRGSVDFSRGGNGSPLLRTSQGGRDAFLWRVNGAGESQEVRQIGGSGDDSADVVAIDAGGQRIYTAGFFSGSAQFGTFADDTGNELFEMQSVGSDDSFGAQYNAPSLSFASATQDGEAQTVRTNDIVVTAAGPVSLSTAGASGHREVRLTTPGSPGRRTTIASTGDMTGGGLALDAAGFVYLTTAFSGKTFGLTAAGAHDILVGKYSFSSRKNTLQYAVSMGGAGDDFGNAIHTVGSGVLIAGSFQGKADFDPSSAASQLKSSGSDDGFLAELLQ